MAMQPLDLQILFSQLDSVAKDAAAQKDGLTLRGAINASVFEKKTEEKSQSVNETHDADNGLEALNSGKNLNSNKKNAKKKYRQENSEQKGAGELFKDPSLGNYIDLSG
ncbi:MAG: hypothetical protein LBB47_04575 [Spirochaetaceae bacterium]|jgi:hypothetical protein|nr:hypothetical protein [Spirochaetaceae bacterium]